MDEYLFVGKFNYLVSYQMENFSLYELIIFSATVFFGEEKRVVRACGWKQISSNASCYKADNEDHLETVCQCFTDGCNGASERNLSLVSALMIVVSILSGLTIK